MFDYKLTKQLAALSKISFSEDELKKMTDDMSEIVRLMDKVREFDKSIAPYTAKEISFNELREDVACLSSTAEDVTNNAKSIKNNCFVVPKII